VFEKGQGLHFGVRREDGYVKQRLDGSVVPVPFRAASDRVLDVEALDAALRPGRARRAAARFARVMVEGSEAVIVTLDRDPYEVAV
jgi:hypothetical protein